MQMWRVVMWVSAAAVAVIGGVMAQAAQPVTVNMYSTQKEFLIRPILEKFEKANPTIKVRLTSIEEGGLLTRLKLEGKDSPADLVMTADVANLYKLQAQGTLAPVKSEVLEKNIPAHLRESGGHWFGFTTRARVIFYAKDRVKPDALSTYADLADPKWKGKIMVRSSNNDYNQSLLASIIANDGKEKALAWAKGVVMNMKSKPAGGDRDQLRAVASGKGDIAISNTYYYGLLETSADKSDRDYAKKLGIIFPNQQDRGAHVNIRGGALVAASKHPKEATAVLEYLSSADAQQFFAEHNFEYPANPSITISKIVAAWGAPKFDTLALEKVGKLNKEAVLLFDQAGWQ